MLARIIGKLNDVQLRNKLILSFVVVVFVPVMFVGLILTNELKKMALEDALEQTATNVERVRRLTLEKLRVPMDISNRLLFDNRLKMVAGRRYQSVYEVVKAYYDYPDLRNYVNYNEEVASIRFYTNNPTLLNNWEFFPVTDDIRRSGWYHSAVRARGVVGWYYIEDETKYNRKYLSLVRRIDLNDYQEHGVRYGVLVISIDDYQLNAILSQEPFETVIADMENNIIAATRRELVGRKLSETYEAGLADLTSGTYELDVNGVRSKVIVDDLLTETSTNGLKIVSIFAIDTIMKDANRFIRLGAFVIAASILVAVVLIYGFSYFLSNRILRLSKKIGSVARGNLDTTIDVDGKDEIGILARQFQYMIRSIGELLEEVHRSNEQKRALEARQNEIRLKMMASQIHPHFLFNALEAVRMKAHMKGEAEIADVVKMIGRLMRKMLESGADRVPLRDELETVRCYLEIQKFRQGDRLSYEIEVEPGLEDVAVLPLSIQPLVENAVIHGIEKKEGGNGWVRVRCTSRAGNVRVEVADNGAGMSAERLARVVSGLDNPEEEGHRIGMRNVHQRLRFTCGEGCGLTVDSRPGQGTVVRFELPQGGNRGVQRAHRG